MIDTTTPLPPGSIDFSGGQGPNPHPGCIPLGLIVLALNTLGWLAVWGAWLLLR